MKYLNGTLKLGLRQLKPANIPAYREILKKTMADIVGEDWCRTEGVDLTHHIGSVLISLSFDGSHQ